MKVEKIVVGGVEVSVFVHEVEGGMCVSLSHDLKNEYEYIAFGKTEEEAKENMKKVLMKS